MTLVTERQRAPQRLPGPWPLVVLVVGYPVWWLLGIASFLPILLAVPMAHQLLRQRHVVRPPALGWWLLFVLWVVLGLPLLWIDAPGAADGGGASRIMVFGFRLAWYVACAVVLVWVTNLSPRVSTGAVHRLLATLFAVCVAGGLLGLLAPTFESRSLVEVLLPGNLAGNEFVSSLVHPQAADVQSVLGRPETRPKAPFPFTNTWGSCLSLSLVFFVAALSRARPGLRLLGVGLLVVAVVPVVYSLNRGLWASIGLGAVGLVVLAVRRGSRRALAALVVAGVIAALLLLASPLGGLLQDRLDHQHSNDRRGQLLSTTVDSVTHGSPVLGFGTTRDVEGSFASITGGATPDCPACGVPPLGTQGQLWLVVFSQGWVGLTLFLGFLLRSLARSWRCRSPAETTSTFVVAFFVLQLPIYDTLGLPLYLVMIAIGLVARDQAESTRPVRRRPVRASVLAATLTLPLLGGTGAGLLVARAQGETDHAGKVSILITPAPVYLAGGSSLDRERLATAGQAREVTIDTEAALLTSQGALAQASAETGLSIDELRTGIEITAPPKSQVLDLRVRSTTSTDADAATLAVAEAYLRSRRDYLEDRRLQSLDGLRRLIRDLGPGSYSVTEVRKSLAADITRLQVSRPEIGQVIRRTPAERLPSAPVVPVESGAALGLLLALLLHHRLTHPTRHHLRPSRPPVQHSGRSS
ncbi:hypothetical protein [Nocardioides sp.]|uniref:hypothetical protein n=1 Tax=Nocardioides sp. TaxID=35761 RepID=UPI002B273336|nr:hypothetical protein [Nocardioides sp.]